MAKPLKNSITLLGSGTSSGVPLVGCTCRVCRSRNPKNHRLRASAWIQHSNKSILIDTSPDLRQQALRARIQRLDAVLYTHPHADHIHGIDDLRAFNFIQKAPLPTYVHDWTKRDLTTRFPYALNGGRSEGGGVPQLDLIEFDPRSDQFDIQGVSIIPLVLQHGSKESVGFRIGSVAYITDCSYIPAESIARLGALDVLILDCVRIAPHPTHYHLEQALQTIEQVKPKRAYLTHLGHEFDDLTWKHRLPRGVRLAYDGLRVEIRR